jgi:hypothetical protein
VNSAEIERCKKELQNQLQKTISFLEQKYLEEPTDMLGDILKKYKKSNKIVRSTSILEIKQGELSIQGSTRAYLDAYTDYLNPLLGEMDKAEKIAKHLAGISKGD